jgi:hypothetical protein
LKIFDSKPSAELRVSHPVFFKAFLRMARAWETLKVAGGHVSWVNGIPTIVVDNDSEDSGGAAWRQVNLGYSQADMVISVTAGYLWFGTLDPITIAAADITLPNTVQDVWIYVKHAWGSVAAELQYDITSLTTPAYPIDDTDYMRWPLTQWRVTETGGVYSAARHSFSHSGDIKITLVRPT